MLSQYKTGKFVALDEVFEVTKKTATYVIVLTSERLQSYDWDGGLSYINSRTIVDNSKSVPVASDEFRRGFENEGEHWFQ